MNGKPLWFLGSVVGAWTALRIALLWPDASTLLAPPARATGEGRTAAMRLPSGATLAATRGATVPPKAAARSAVRRVHDTFGVEEVGPVSGQAGVADAPESRDRPFVGSAPIVPAGLPGTPSATGGARWSGSGWLILRDGGAAAPLSPLLGGAQAGARIAYAFDRARRMAVFGRVAGPLGRGSADLAVGGQWRPGRAAVTVYGEGRLLNGRLTPAVGAFGGGAIAIGGFRLDGYGQAGVIARGGVSGFGDGQVRLTRRIGRAELGAGAWGGAQRGASRLDVGPSVALALPVRPLDLRLTIDWRRRIAGNARPAGGPVLSLGADF